MDKNAAFTGIRCHPKCYLLGRVTLGTNILTEIVSHKYRIHTRTHTELHPVRLLQTARKRRLSLAKGHGAIWMTALSPSLILQSAAEERAPCMGKAGSAGKQLIVMNNGTNLVGIWLLMLLFCFLLWRIQAGDAATRTHLLLHWEVWGWCFLSSFFHSFSYSHRIDNPHIKFTLLFGFNIWTTGLQNDTFLFFFMCLPAQCCFKSLKEFSLNKYLELFVCFLKKNRGKLFSSYFIL